VENQATIDDPASLRSRYPEPDPTGIVARKIQHRLDRHSRAFIALSPFLVIATGGARGVDASPRGDRPGFVAAPDDHTLLLPDRPGNNLCDTMTNLLDNAQVGLIFFVPGISETLRVNGSARIVVDPDALAAHAVDGKPARSVLRIAVAEVYFHCGKALIRSRLWDEQSRVPRSTLPSLGQILADQISGVDAPAAEARLQESYRTRLY
jgi:PPOX class probable FMN-dependent enzyme